MKNPGLPDHAIALFEDYVNGDVRTFHLLIDLLRAQGYHICPERSLLNEVIKGFDNMAWTPDQRDLWAHWPEGMNETRTDMAPAYSLCHQAMHTLLACRYGKEVRGKPGLTNLGEALAGSLEIYFELSRTSRKGIDLKSKALEGYTKNSTKLKRPFISLYNQGVKDPFDAYRRTVIAQLEFTDFLFRKTTEIQSGRLPRSQELIRQARKFDRLVFFMHKDFSVFVLYMHAFCGTRSSAEDRRDTADAIQILNQSSNMVEFLKKLGIDRSIAGKNEERHAA
jgi:hypothetical protein